ncbi:hypothetical protein [Pseudoclavibacter sp. RFBB5]|uniref:hypothetical protein n=1 Tax=Pseudoclavibacter sp. RFBB5 TaxID=2080574 RepID=UPI000CE91EE5|nr:hypothetical protein [Pseudoclavibacter sp. RFBB5]PPG29644.1 hypothetical protein C5B97_11775 [Pseudoclavibacter sp. RFBB5]
MTTTRKTATRRPAAKAAPEPVAEIELTDLDFDNWTEEAEEEAVERLRSELKPKFLLVEKSLAAKFPSGFILKTSLDVPYSKLTEIMEAGEGSDDQMMAVLEFLGQKDEVPILQEQGVIAVMAFAGRYFELWQKVAGTSLGESDGSSES